MYIEEMNKINENDIEKNTFYVIASLYREMEICILKEKHITSY